jgi:hypothetical protein
MLSAGYLTWLLLVFVFLVQVHGQVVERKTFMWLPADACRS